MKKYKIFIIVILIFVFSFFTLNSKPGDFLFFGKSTYEYARQLFNISSSAKTSFQTNIISSRIDDFKSELRKNDCVQAKLIESNLISNLQKFSSMSNANKDSKHTASNFYKLATKFKGIPEAKTNCTIETFYSVAGDLLYIYAYENVDEGRANELNSDIQNLKNQFNSFKDSNSTLPREKQEVISDFLVGAEANFSYAEEMFQNSNNFQAAKALFENKIILSFLINYLENPEEEFRSLKYSIDFLCILNFSSECEVGIRQATWNSIFSNKEILMQFSLSKQQFDQSANKYFNYIYNIE